MSGHRPWRCRLLGCRWDFGAAGDQVRWRCRRCGAEGLHRCGSAAEARRVARFCQRGRSRPPTGLLAALGGTLHRPGPD